MKNYDFCDDERIIELKDENNVPVKVRLSETFVDNGRFYVIADDLDDDESSYILEIVSKDDNVELVSVDDEALFDHLAELASELFDYF